MPPMIVRFAVDSDALGMNSPETLIGLSNHQRLIECWEDWGILIHEEDFENSIKALPPLRQTLWKDALRVNRHALFPNSQHSLSKVMTSEDLSLFTGHLDLACLDEVRAVLVGMPEEETSFMAEGLGLEVCRIDLADRSRAFGTSRELSKEPIISGTRVDDVWQERFAMLEAFSRHITLADRYCIERHKYCASRQRRSGLRKIITTLGQAGQTHSLNVCCSDYNCKEHDAVTLLRDLVQSMNQGGLDSVRLYVAPETFFKRHFHYRYLRFDRTMCQLDTGTEALEGVRVTKLCAFSVLPYNRAKKQLEEDLRQQANEFVIL
jgi:hypothetical protein